LIEGILKFGVPLHTVDIRWGGTSNCFDDFVVFGVSFGDKILAEISDGLMVDAVHASTVELWVLAFELRLGRKRYVVEELVVVVPITMHMRAWVL